MQFTLPCFDLHKFDAQHPVTFHWYKDIKKSNLGGQVESPANIPEASNYRMLNILALVIALNLPFNRFIPIFQCIEDIVLLFERL